MLDLSIVPELKQHLLSHKDTLSAIKCTLTGFKTHDSNLIF